MDLLQRKLTKSEWDTIEIPVSSNELEVLDLIIKGYTDINVRINHNNSLLQFLKIEYSEKMDEYLFSKFLKKYVDKLQERLKKYNAKFNPIKNDAIIKLNSIDRIRLERYNEQTIHKNNIYEFVVLREIDKLIDGLKSSNEKEVHLHYYTIDSLMKNSVDKLNQVLCQFVHQVLQSVKDRIDLHILLTHAYDIIEKNKNLIQYSDLTLYEHQKEICTAIKRDCPKLILYIAPTGTGKTLTPIALSEGYKVIFICAARHVGLALARAAISIHKKIAFAFGCETANDIRLHYSAAKEFTRNKYTGGIRKVDNSVGNNVEIMICDIKSYLPAMYYMLAFFKKEELVLYWDEPTITMDYVNHPFHVTIHENWKNNLIPNVVLSSATLPKFNELTGTIGDFMEKFADAEIVNIVSHDCKKSVPIINKDGFVVMPHYLHEKYDDVLKVADHCCNNLTLLRYLDLREISNFLNYIFKMKFGNAKTKVERHFETATDVNMKNIKMYYINVLKNIKPENWASVYEHFMQCRVPRIIENTGVDPKGNKIKKMNSVSESHSLTTRIDRDRQGAPISRISSEYIERNHTLAVPNITANTKGTSGAYITTKDSYTLTDGPTIFICNDIEKIAKFCIQQANIPSIVMNDIMKKIEYNNNLNDTIRELENELNAMLEGKDEGAFGKLENKQDYIRLSEKINTMRAMIKTANLNDGFIPNRKLHLEKWAEGMELENPFTSRVDDTTACEIMRLHGVSDTFKILLMMGIGVFINHENIAYTEIMKHLADSQQLYLIIAASDYIYGTNYSFCHGFLGKDLDLTQEKIVQAMGRIGRNNIQQQYTVRFRDDEQIYKIFTSETEKPEIINMNVLFNSKHIIYENGEYIEM
jgi:hypothetical protein